MPDSKLHFALPIPETVVIWAIHFVWCVSSVSTALDGPYESSRVGMHQHPALLSPFESHRDLIGVENLLIWCDENIAAKYRLQICQDLGP